VRIFFAGGENKSHSKYLSELGVKNILISYYYLHKKNKKMTNTQKVNELYDQFGKDAVILCDSGAATLQKNC